MTDEMSHLAPAWRCPVCQLQLVLTHDRRRWTCGAGHSFDVASEGYVNLLHPRQRRSRRPGDSPEMVRARRKFLATGAYDPLTNALANAVMSERPDIVLDVGCGEGRHTRALSASTILGVDVAKPAIAAAARSHPAGSYAVASVAELPLFDSTVDVAMNVFGPSGAAELARVVKPGGIVVAAHPGPNHLEGLRQLVYPDAHPHNVKPPLRSAGSHFEEIGSSAVTFSVTVTDESTLRDLFAMTPYIWHAPIDVDQRIANAIEPSFQTVADVRITQYRRNFRA